MDNNERDVLGVMDEWRRLAAEGDVDGLLALTTDDVVFLTPGNEPMDKERFAAGLRQALGKARIVLTQEVKEIRTSADRAYTWSHLSVELVPKNGGAGQQSSGYTLTVFQRSPSGEWRIARDANLTTGAGNPDRI